MTTFSTDEIKKLAKLAAIAINDDDVKVLMQQVGDTISWIDKLKEVDINGVAPLTNINDINLRMVKDIVADGGIAEDVLNNAPESKYNYFAVPKVIES